MVAARADALRGACRPRSVLACHGLPGPAACQLRRCRKPPVESSTNSGFHSGTRSGGWQSGTASAIK